ncbi:helix-turn-helix domain-containing protein [Aeromicrobium sp. NPDC092404]|uniref:helix-turn-helix domain-containing protein n=1 Tax=Aeromicrobium sp. NPDC092404 TaxID=3154976 RepID=UPI00342EE8D9
MTNETPSTTQLPEIRVDWSLHPGVVLSHVLKQRAMRQAELAERTGLSPKHVNQIVKGAVGITPDVAVLLERALDTPPRFWANVGVDWEVYLSEQRASTSLRDFTTWASKFDAGTLIRHGVVGKGDSLPERANKLLRFFGVASPAAFEQTWMRPRVSFKRSQAYTVDEQNTALWLGLVEHCAKGVDVSPYKPARLRKAAAQIPAFTTMPFMTGFEAAQASLAGAGVALVFVRQVPETRVCAATWWIDDQPAIGITERHKKPDIFWFSLLHEIGHLLLHPRRKTFLDLEGDREADDDAEVEANEYAASVLFPGDARDRIGRARTRQELILLAADLKLGLPVVAGQHGHLTNNWQVGGKLRSTISDQDVASLEEWCQMPAIVS